MRIKIEDLHQGYNKNEILHGINAHADTGEIVALLGPNGSGKSTLIRTISCLIPPISGKIMMDDIDLNSLSIEERAKRISYVPQSFSYMPFTTVLDTVLTGRNPYMGWEPSDEDLAIAEESLKMLGILELATTSINELSGGQRQRVFIARALCQDPNFFIFDEPTSSLDLKYQIETMKKMRNIVSQKNAGLIIAVHDLNLAFRYADRILLLKDGNIICDGNPTEVINEISVMTAYSVKCIMSDTEHGKFIFPYDVI